MTTSKIPSQTPLATHDFYEKFVSNLQSEVVNSGHDITVRLGNVVIGEGRHRHEVPTADKIAVHMRDAHHQGTLIVYLKGDERTHPSYVFTQLDDFNVARPWTRCVLIKLGQCPVELLDEENEAPPTWWYQFNPVRSGVAYDLPAGLIMLGVEWEAVIDTRLGDVMWDSRESP